MALTFPAKVYQILENESADIVRWHENGIAFRILDHGRFEREIIPKYFRHNQLSSVQRQLNLYGFKCISRGEDKGSFFHVDFKRGGWDAVRKITRYVPLKRSLPDGSFFIEQRKSPQDEEYVFRDGSYHNVNYANDSNSFASFQIKSSGSAADLECSPHPHSVSPASNSPSAPAPSAQQRPSSPVNRQYNIKPASSIPQRASSASLPQKTTTISTAETAERSYLVISNNIVRIDPNYDLGDALNLTYEEMKAQNRVNSAVNTFKATKDTKAVYHQQVMSVLPPALQMQYAAVYSPTAVTKAVSPVYIPPLAPQAAVSGNMTQQHSVNYHNELYQHHLHQPQQQHVAPQQVQVAELPVYEHTNTSSDPQVQGVDRVCSLDEFMEFYGDF